MSSVLIVEDDRSTCLFLAETLKAAGFKPVALGRSTLRFDTAALAALVLTAQARLGTPPQES